MSVLEEIKAGVPSHVTENLDRVAFSEDEVRERMSGNLCRCGAHNGIVEAIEAMLAETAA